MNEKNKYRYRNDARFKYLVDWLTKMMRDGCANPGELRDALELASCEQRRYVPCGPDYIDIFDDGLADQMQQQIGDYARGLGHRMAEEHNARFFAAFTATDPSKQTHTPPLGTNTDPRQAAGPQLID